MKHILFVTPYLWKKEFDTMEFDDVRVAWLLAVPISEAESQYAKKNGINALTDLFEKKEIDVCDLNRQSVVI